MIQCTRKKGRRLSCGAQLGSLTRRLVSVTGTGIMISLIGV